MFDCIEYMPDVFGRKSNMTFSVDKDDGLKYFIDWDTGLSNTYLERKSWRPHGLVMTKARAF